MAKQQERNSLTNQQGSGSEYHRKHASNVPDYGANSMDPMAEGLTNMADDTESTQS